MVKCEVCALTDHKYKCPKCLIKYCSLACYKQHQESICADRTPNVIKNDPSVRDQCQTGSSSQLYSEDAVPLEKLELLKHDGQILTSLENPHLREIMMNINASSNPGADLKNAMQEPIFTEFADQCLRLVEKQDSKIVLPTKSDTILIKK